MLKFFLDSTFNAYAQIFFTKNRATAVIVLLASCLNPKLGLCGLASVWLSNGLAYLFGFDKRTIQEGLFALNGLLVGMGLAQLYEVNAPFVLLWFAILLLTLLLSVAMMNYLARLALPALVLPFVVAFWVVAGATRQYTGLEWSEGSIFLRNEIFRYGGMTAVEQYEGLQNLVIPTILEVYLKSLASILFQNNLAAGVLIALGILISSRIAFTLSVIGYLVGYGFYYYIGADLSQLLYVYIGFNFILTAIGLGGFFFIPTWKTYGLVVLITPIIAIFIAAFSAFLQPFQLPMYSLPFVAAVLLVLYVANFIRPSHNLTKVIHQQFSPERNLYAFRNWKNRFEGKHFFRIGLPFFGEWTISQGHDGDITHKADWQHAWDFVIADETDKTYQNAGIEAEDFYAYGLPVIAPADGYVVHILNHVEDNPIGRVNLEHNWGNVLIVKHGDFLYSKIGHLKKDSFKVAIGDFVKKGQVLAHLGNSGRSPEPHLHFQIQATPYVGAKTLHYPLSYFLLKTQAGWAFQEVAVPKQGTVVQNVVTKPLLVKAFQWELGQTLTFRVAQSNRKAKPETVRWEAGVDISNQTYLYCHATKSHAYYVHDGTLFYFTTFEGDRNSLLYYFYLGAHKVLLGYYPSLKIEDEVPLHLVVPSWQRWIQDFFAPFWIYRKILYRLHYTAADNALQPKTASLRSQIAEKRLWQNRPRYRFELELKDNVITHFSVKSKRMEWLAILEWERF